MVGLQAPDDLPQPPTAGPIRPNASDNPTAPPTGTTQGHPKVVLPEFASGRVLIPPVRRLSVPVRGLHLPGARLSSVPVALCPPASSEAGRLCMGSRQGGLAGIRG